MSNTIDSPEYSGASDDLQLDLFSWDRLKIAQGFAALERLDFPAAETVFDSVLGQLKDHREALFGGRLVADWKDQAGSAATMTTEEAVRFLLPVIMSYGFGVLGAGLRRGLIGMIALRMERDGLIFIAPDIHLGLLFMETGQYSRAHDAFIKHLDQEPKTGLIMGFAADSLWMQGRGKEASLLYARALLLSPLALDVEKLRDARLRKVIMEEGVVHAPVYGWLEEILPLVEEVPPNPVNKEHRTALDIYSAVILAEKSRLSGDHAGMVESRRRLRGSSREVFGCYMERLRWDH